MGAQRRIESSLGREIGITGLGNPLSRRLVVFCHPMPGASGFDPDPVETQGSGVHLLTLDRPGYGATDPWREGEPADVCAWAAELAEWIVSSMKEGDRHAPVDFVREIGIVGWGAGGAYALALAAELGDRADRLALVGTRSPHRLAAFVSSGRLDVDGRELPDDDDLGGRMARMLDDAHAQGDAGLGADRAALSSTAWSSSISSLTADTLLVYRSPGAEDRASSDARWYVRHLPRATIGMVRGGIPIVRAWGRILQHVAPERGAPTPEMSTNPQIL